MPMHLCMQRQRPRFNFVAFCDGPLARRSALAPPPSLWQRALSKWRARRCRALGVELPPVRMPLKKPGGLGGLSFAFEKQSSFNLSDTGSFSSEQFTFGHLGITQSPLSQGEVSSLRLDELQLGAVLGRGASSRVHYAVHIASGKPLAIKVLQGELEASEETRAMVLNEMKVIFNAQSDHLVAFYDAFLHEGAVYLALEHMDCGSLEGVLRALAATPARVMPEHILAHVMFQIMQGLTYLHKERRAVHRDLKPANVLLNSAGFVKLSDFGIAKVRRPAEAGSRTPPHLAPSLERPRARAPRPPRRRRPSPPGAPQVLPYTNAQAGTSCGTVAYLSPERVRGESYGLPSDIWSFGLIALECAIGAYPYPPTLNMFDAMRTIVDGPPPTERPDVQAALSVELLDLAHAALRKDASLRPDVVGLLRHPFIATHGAQATADALPNFLRQFAASPPPPVAAVVTPTAVPSAELG